MVYDQLKTMIADQLGVSEDEVKPETRLKEDLKADSATVMMLVMDIENEFDIEIEDDAIERSRPSPIWSSTSKISSNPRGNNNRKRTCRAGGAPFPCISFRAAFRAKRNGRGDA